MSRYQAVILDIDGTLVDSNDLHARAWVDVFEEFGHSVRYDEVRKLIGMGGDKLVPEILGSDDQLEALEDRRGEVFMEQYMPQVRAFPQVRALVERCRASGLKVVVATSAPDEQVGSLLERAGVRDLIEEATSADDAEDSKPAPDIVQAAVRRSGLEPENLVMLGDTPYDVAAARSAGVSIIALRCGGWEADELEGALAVYDDPADLLDQFESSVLAA